MKNKKKVLGAYCGESVIDGKACQIFTHKGHFIQSIDGKFQKFLKRSKVRLSGIWVTFDKSRKALYGKQGYIGV